MKILLVSSFDQKGGAGKAAFRTLKALQSAGQEASMFVQESFSTAAGIYGGRTSLEKQAGRFRAFAAELPKKISRKKSGQTFIGCSLLKADLAGVVRRIQPDVVNLHWTHNGFVSLRGLERLRIPLVWTMHDCWTFTGGCIYPSGCERFQDRCGKCPALGSHFSGDASRRNWRRKMNFFKKNSVHMISPSNWLRGQALRSTIHSHIPVTVIPNPIDLNLYRPIVREHARRILGLPPDDRKLILFGADGGYDTERKGFGFFRKAVERLRSEHRRDFSVVTFGSLPGPVIPGIQVFSFDALRDDYSLVALYSACNLFVLPTLQDNLPNTIAESMACQCPPVAFRIGGIPDLITHKRDGYLAEPGSAEDLARGMDRVIGMDDDRMARAARDSIIGKCEFSVVTREYMKVFSEAIAARG